MKKAFTFVEIMVAITVFSLLMLGASGIFIAINQGWQRQRTDLALAQNCRWAMELMVNDIRNAADPNIAIISGDDGLWFSNKSGPGKTFFWRGDGGSSGDAGTLYKAIGNGFGNAKQPGTRQELANFIATNPLGNPIFGVSGELATIELTTASGAKTFTMRTKVRVRNN